MVLIPMSLDFLKGNDVSFEIAASSQIQTIKLYHRHNLVTQSIALVFAHGDTYDTEISCSKMLREGLKIDRVHTCIGFSLSQVEEKITWVAEKTTSCLCLGGRLQIPLCLVVIVNISSHGLFIEDYHEDYYDWVNTEYGCQPQIFPKAIDYTSLYKNFMEITYEDKNEEERCEFISMIELSSRLSNITHNNLILFDVTFQSSQ